MNGEIIRSTQLTRWRMGVILALALAAYTLGLTAQPADESAAPATQPAETPESTTGSTPAPGAQTFTPGLHAFIDPATGELAAPTADQLFELERFQSTDPNLELTEPDAVVPVPGLESGIMVPVPAELHPAVVATVGPDGEVSVDHESPLGPDGEVSVDHESMPPGAMIEDGAEYLGLGPDGAVDLTLKTSLAPGRFLIVNNDGAGEGFNDPTAVTPVFGNPGTTLGAQRLNVFQAAGDFWAGIVKTAVDVRVASSMDPLTCSAGSAVLGSAGPNTAHANFANRPVANVWYVQAVANALSGADQSGSDDITARFNSSIDNNNNCLAGTNWWYGIGAPAPAGTVDFLAVVLHEIGHGIGNLSLVSLATGAKLAGLDDAYELWLWDLTVGGWPAMTNAQRLTSSTNTGNVIFWGSRATDAARGFLTAGMAPGGGPPDWPRVYAPNPVQGGSSISHWDTVAFPNELMEPFITSPPGPYQYVTDGLLQDVGWPLLTNGVIDFGAAFGTYTWNPTGGFFRPTLANPSNLEAWSGHFVGIYNGTWLWNGTTGAWTQLTAAIPQSMRACGDNLLWEYSLGTWAWNVATGWQFLTGADPDSIECWGGKMVWESPAFGTYLYDFTTGWTRITTVSPDRLQPCGANLVWQGAAFGTYVYNFNAGWLGQITAANPESMVCWRGNLVWEWAFGTWIYNFATGWSQITSADPEQIVTWGPKLIWEGAPFGTWLYDAVGGFTQQITAANPTLLAPLGPDLLWVNASGVWKWDGAAWTSLTTAGAEDMVSTGVPEYNQ